jgi:hypothetical protein
MSLGRRLFRRESDISTLHAILTEPVPLPTSVIPTYPARLEAIVMRALARDRDERYDSAQTLAQDLLALARDEGWPTDSAALADYVKDIRPTQPTPINGEDAYWEGWPASSGSFSSMSRVSPDYPHLTGAGQAGKPSGDPSDLDVNLGWSDRSVILMGIVMIMVISLVFWLVVVPQL